MSSYFKSFENFVQQKENPRVITANILSEPDPDPHDQRNVTDDEGNVAASDLHNRNTKMMEHSYIRDNFRPSSDLTGLPPARTIIVSRPPQCPSCHTHPLEEHDMDDGNKVPVPSYNEISSKEAMNACARIAKYVKNPNPDEEDWEARINQLGWTNAQKGLFEKAARILDDDQLGRLGNAGRQHEVIHRRSLIDKSASRFRTLFASIGWDARLTEWLHCLLMENLPATYMASYLDVLQTLKTKIPMLMEKLLFARPLNYSQEVLAPVLTKQWELELNIKNRKLSQDAVIIAVPSMPYSGTMPSRLQKWYQYLSTIARIVQVCVPMTSGYNKNIPLDAIAEQTVAMIRVKVQELKNEEPGRSIILVGFNAGGSLALQAAIVEPVAAVVCIGFAYNTLNGPRGAPDDRILDIKIPIMFVVGQSSAKSSPEEIESMREKMQSETTLVVVGSADDVLRVPKIQRKLQNVTQSMVDNMVVDEVYEFISKILKNPPGPRLPTPVTSLQFMRNQKTAAAVGETKLAQVNRKRKQDMSTIADGDPSQAKTRFVGHIGRPRTRPLPQGASGKMAQRTQFAGGKGMALKATAGSNNLNKDNLSMESGQKEATAGIASSVHIQSPQKMVSSLQTSPIKTTIINPMQKHQIATVASIGGAGAKIKMIPSSQFVQLKSSMQSQSKIYTIKTPSSGLVNQSSVTSTGSPGLVVTPVTTPTGQQQIFTLKTPSGQTTQYVTAAATAASGQQKFAVVRNATGGTTIQLASTASGSGVAAAGGTTANTTAPSDISNIIDMPILFADNDGNLTDSVAQKPDNVPKPIVKSSSSGVGQLIISQKIIKEADPVIKSSITMQGQQQPPKTNKVVLINRNTMKPISFGQNATKFTKVVVSNAKTQSTTVLPRTATSALGSPIVVSSNMKQVNLQGLKTTPVTLGTRQGGILNVAGKPLQNFQIINTGNVVSGSIGTAGSSDKPQIRNIVVKSGNLKQIPPHLKTQLLNRNLTVRKLVNIVPVSKSGNSTPITYSPIEGATQVSPEKMQRLETEQSPNAATSSNSGISPALQTTPKIITLNPPNTSGNITQESSE